MPVRVLLVEDNDVYRSSLELLLGLADEVEVVGGVRTGDEAVGVCDELRPDVVLMDLRLPGMDGVEATAAVRRTAPDVAVVCLTAQATPEERQAAVAAGAVSVVAKGEPTDALVAAIRTAAGR